MSLSQVPHKFHEIMHRRRNRSSQELIIRRREYRTVKLSPESNVTIQLRFDALTCCVFANIIQASANQVM